MTDDKAWQYTVRTCDLHLHTIVSDGEITPGEILSCAKEFHLEKISITDHDAVGAYIHFETDLFEKAKEMGIEIIPGIELDSTFSEIEVHVLGYGINIENKELKNYLSKIHTLRRQRIEEQMEKINRFYKKEIIKRDEIIIPYRDTLMKPHLVHELLKKGLFSEYREAARWVSDHARSSVSISKFHTGEMIELIKRCGGQAFLAHPGYYMLEGGLDIDKMVNELLPAGLAGLEVEYPYLGTGPKFQTPASEREIIETLYHTARKYGLNISGGSDAHTLEQMKAFSRRVNTRKSK